MSSLPHILVLGGSGRVGQYFITQALSQGYQVTALVRRANALPPQENLTLVIGTPTSSTDILTALASISERAPSSSTRTGDDVSNKTKVAIVSVLGQTRANPSNPWSAPTSPAFFMAQAAQAVVDAVRTFMPSTPASPAPSPSPTTATAGAPTLANITIHKYIACSMFGAGDSWSSLHWLFRVIMSYSNMRQTVEDHDRVIEVVSQNFATTTAVTTGTSTTTTTTTTISTNQNGQRQLAIPFVLVRPAMFEFDDISAATTTTTTGTGPVVSEVPPAPTVKEWGSGAREMGFMPKTNWRSVVAFLLERVTDATFDGRMPVISN